jgi:hypothetical protein
MNRTSEQTIRRFLAVGRKVLKLCVPGLLALTALTVVAIVPAPLGRLRSGNQMLLWRSLQSPSMAAPSCHGWLQRLTEVPPSPAIR